MGRAPILHVAQHKTTHGGFAKINRKLAMDKTWTNTKETMQTVSALFVEKNGPYFGLPGVDPWDAARDARKYEGPFPVVAHPPCSRWCQLAGVVEKRYGYKRGEDDGCFESALASVRRWGGVLEHPAYSLAWPRFDLPTPPRAGWLRALDGGFVAQVEQGHYGHLARKATWLYAFGVYDLPVLKWGPSEGKALVSWMNNHGTQHDKRPRVGKRDASKTPNEFREILLRIARSVTTTNHYERNQKQLENCLAKQHRIQ